MNAPTMNSHAIACVAAVGDNDPALVGAVVRAMEDNLQAYCRIGPGDRDGLGFDDTTIALTRALAILGRAMKERYESKAKEASNGEA